MKKRLISLILSVILLISVLSAQAEPALKTDLPRSEAALT